MLKGIASATKVIKATGERRTYYYAWRGGPQLPGSPGSPEFVAAYHEAVRSRTTASAKPDALHSVIAAFKGSGEFKKLAPRTKADYAKHIAKIEQRFGSMPLPALSARKAQGVFLTWRDELAESSPRQADYAWTVLARILSVGKRRGLVAVNPCEKGGRLYQAERTEQVWTDDDEAAFLRHAPRHLHLGLMLALWTGQRQGDLLRLTWNQYDGRYIRLRQGKTGARVTVPVGAPLKALLDAEPRRGALVLLTAKGEPWTEDGFRSSWRKACKAAGVTAGLTFHDLRGSAVSRLAGVGATVPEIATLTGHSLRDVQEILDVHYLSRDVSLAESAITKLEGRKAANRTANREAEA